MLTKAVKNTGKATKFTKKTKRSSRWFLTPSFLGVFTFFILPFFVVIYYSMVNNPIMHEFVFLDNFSKVATNGAFVRAVRNTAMFSAIAVPLAVVLSLVLAVVLNQRLPFHSQFRTAFLSPMMSYSGADDKYLRTPTLTFASLPKPMIMSLLSVESFS